MSVFYRLIFQLGISEKRFDKLEDLLIETPQNEKHREENKQKRTENPGTAGQFQKV